MNLEDNKCYHSVEAVLDTTELKIEIQMLDDKAIMPTYGSDGAAGLDLYALVKNGARRQTIPTGQTIKIRTGVALAIPKGYFGAVFARSGLATKKGLRPANCVGVIDSDYRGEIFIALHNDSPCNETVVSGDRIAQLAIIPCPTINLVQVDELPTSERGEGGFGSTGK